MLASARSPRSSAGTVEDDRPGPGGSLDGICVGAVADLGPHGHDRPDDPEEVGPDHFEPSGWRRPSIDSMVALVLVLAGLRIGLAPLHDNSFMTHLATGRLILDDGAIPTADPYSFTALGRDWTVQSWLASVVYAGTEEAFGLRGIRALVALLTCGLVLLAWRLSRPAALVARLVLAVLVVGIGSNLWVERPLLFGLMCLGALLLAAEHQLDPRWLVLVMWIWVNAHGSVPLGLVALGLLALGRRFDGQRTTVELRALGWAAVGTALGAVNPLGPKLLVFPLQLLENREAFDQIVEWGRRRGRRPPSGSSPCSWRWPRCCAWRAVAVGAARCRCWCSAPCRS